MSKRTPHLPRRFLLAALLALGCAAAPAASTREVTEAEARRLAEKTADHAGAVVQVQRDLELVGDDLLAGLAYDEVDGGSGAGEAVEEPPSVGDAGASGDGEDEAALGHRTLFSATH